MEPHQTSSYYPPSPIRLISNSRSSFRRDPYHRPDPRPSSGPALLPPLSFYDPSPRYHIMEPHQTSSYYPPSPIRLISNSRSSFRRDPYHRPDPRPSSGPALLPPLSFYDPSPRYHNNNHHNNHNNNDQHNNDHHHHHHQDSRIFQSIPTITPNFPRPHPMGTHQSPVVLPIQTSFDHMRMRTTSESLPAHHVHHHHHVQKVPTEVSYQEEEYIREDPSVRYENRMDLSHPSSSPATIPQLDRQSSSLFERMSHAPTKGKWKKEVCALVVLYLASGYMF